MDVMNTVESIISVVQKEQDKEIIDAIKKWANESPGFRNFTLVDEDKLKEILLLGAKEYEKIHGTSVKIGEKYSTL